MEKKKNILIIILIIIIVILCCAIGWLLGSKFAGNENEIVKETNIEENNNNGGQNSVNLEKVDIEEAFNNFVTEKNLNTSRDVFDLDGLNSKNCIDAISASESGYSLELYKFSDNDSAKKEYNEQNNYQLEVNNVKQVIGSGSTNNYDNYEAILVPNLEMSPAATGNEYNYIYQLRIDNFYIVLYETSNNSDKTSMINISNELKESLGIK